MLRRAADERGVFLGDEVMDFMLKRFSRDLSSLMLLLERLDGYALRTQRAITIPLIKSMLEDEWLGISPHATGPFRPRLHPHPLDSDHAWSEFTVRLGWRDAEDFRRANDGYYADYKAGTLDVHDYTCASPPARCAALAEGLRAHERFMAGLIRPAMTEAARAPWCAATRTRATPCSSSPPPTPSSPGPSPRPSASNSSSPSTWPPIRRANSPAPSRAFLLPRGQGRPCGTMAGRSRPALVRSGAHSTFYSDSMNDLPLLEGGRTGGHSPDQRLATLAKQRGWRILNLFE